MQNSTQHHSYLPKVVAILVSSLWIGLGALLTIYYLKPSKPTTQVPPQPDPPPSRPEGMCLARLFDTKSPLMYAYVSGNLWVRIREPATRGQPATQPEIRQMTLTRDVEGYDALFTVLAATSANTPEQLPKEWRPALSKEPAQSLVIPTERRSTVTQRRGDTEVVLVVEEGSRVYVVTDGEINFKGYSQTDLFAPLRLLRVGQPDGR